MNGVTQEFFDGESVEDNEIKQNMDDEIANVPQDPGELIERLEENHASSPADSGGDIEYDWRGERFRLKSDAGPIRCRGKCPRDGHQFRR